MCTPFTERNPPGPLKEPFCADTVKTGSSQLDGHLHWMTRLVQLGVIKVGALAGTTASVALKAAREAFGKRGGGLVEAYPIVKWGAYREYSGTVSMFKWEGFKIVAPFGQSNVVMRRRI